MTTELFGAPVGFEAGYKDQLTQAQILQAHAHAQQLQAQTQLFGAEAQQKIQASAAQQRMAEIEAKVTADEAAARQARLTDRARNGEVATVANSQDDGSPVEGDSQGLLLKAHAQRMIDAGAPLSTQTAAMKAAAEMLETEQKTRTSAAQARKDKMEAEKIDIAKHHAMAQTLASIAGAGLGIPEAEYPRWAAIQRATNPEAAQYLPSTKNIIHLTAMQRAGQSADEQYKQALAERKIIEDKEIEKSKATLRIQQGAMDEAKAQAAKAYAAKTHYALKQAQKEEGTGSKGLTELQKATLDAKNAARLARESKDFPAAPLDGTDAAYYVGARFTDRQGRRVQVVGKDPVTGYPRFKELKVPNVSQKPPPESFDEGED